MRDRKRLLRSLLVEVVPGAKERDDEPAADHHHDDRELQHEDLCRQSPGRHPVRRSAHEAGS